MTAAQREAILYPRSQGKRLAESGLEPWLSDIILHSFSTNEQADNLCFMLGGVGQPSNGARGRWVALARGYAVGGDLEPKQASPLLGLSLVPGLEGSSGACCHDSRHLGPGMPADSVGGGLRNSSLWLLSVGDKEGGTQTEHALLEPPGSEA